MKIIHTSLKVVFGSAALLAVALLIVGCRTPTHEQADKAKTATPAGAKSNGKGASQLWAENCVRCHNIRSPSVYSDAEWEVAMHHMRIRANLTAEEHHKILEFLKSAN